LAKALQRIGYRPLTTTFPMEVVMKRPHIFFPMILAAVFLVSLPTEHSAQRNPTNEKNRIENVIEGQLLNVDTKSKIISLRGPDQKETIFNYNDDTSVISRDKTAQGLTGKTGVQLRISYREDRGVRLATRIEVIETP
jgi:hypothetical protein